MTEKSSFAVAFFRLYDKKIAGGEITFASTGIKKNDFIRLCMEKDYVFDEETISRICQTMLLTDEEEKNLKESAGC